MGSNPSDSGAGSLGPWTASFADADFGVVGSIVGYSGLSAGRTGIIVALVACLVLFFLASAIMEKRAKATK